MNTYTADIKKKSKGSSKSFLSMHTLVKEVESEVFKLPKWAFYGDCAAFLIAVASIFAPIAFTVYTSSQGQKIKLAHLQSATIQLVFAINSNRSIATIRNNVADLPVSQKFAAGQTLQLGQRSLPAPMRAEMQSAIRLRAIDRRNATLPMTLARFHQDQLPARLSVPAP